MMIRYEILKALILCIATLGVFFLVCRVTKKPYLILLGYSIGGVIGYLTIPLSSPLAISIWQKISFIIQIQSLCFMVGTLIIMLIVGIIKPYYQALQKSR